MRSTYLFLVMLALASCSDNEESIDDWTGSVPINPVNLQTNKPEGSTERAVNEEDLLANSSFTHIVKIHWGEKPNAINPLEGKGVEVVINGGLVTVISTVEGVAYELTGATTNGGLKVFSDHKFKLDLNTVQIENPTGPAINIQSSKRAFVMLHEGSSNVLKDGSSYVVTPTEDAKGTFFSEGKLIFSGSGSLAVSSKSGHAIVSDDYVRVVSGTIQVTEAAKDAIHTNDAVIIEGGVLNLVATDDGIQCEEGYIVINGGEIAINSVGKAITASWDTDTTIDPYVVINGGTITINTQDEGIESKSVLTINDGTIRITSVDDAINAGSFIYINGGEVYAHSTGNDGIDSNGPMTVTGGLVYAIGARQPEGGIDCDRSTFKVTGGLIVGLGGSTSSPTASASTQHSVIMNGYGKNELIALLSEDGEEALVLKVPVDFSTFLLSTPKLIANKKYYVYTGGNAEGGTDLNGLYTSGTYHVGSRGSQEFQTKELVVNIGGSVGPGGPGGR